uniref:UPF0506 domain-containing protein n=1 Tax=Ascaris lumbricoides TaxID=6252 RepID=A0A0M3HKU3_ASCLU
MGTPWCFIRECITILVRKTCVGYGCRYGSCTCAGEDCCRI